MAAYEITVTVTTEGPGWSEQAVSEAVGHSLGNTENLTITETRVTEVAQAPSES